MTNCIKCKTANNDTAKFCKKCGVDLTESKVLEKKQEIERMREEAKDKANAAGYFESKMCPFTIAQVGGTKMVGFGGSTMNEYTWQHSACMGKYCKMWDTKHNDCLIKLAAQSLKK